MQKILIAFNDNLSALNATKYGIELAKKINAQVGLIEVTNYSIGAVEAGVMPIDLENAGVLQSKAHIEQIKKVYPNLHIEEFEPIGIPDKELNETIKLWDADILVAVDSSSLSNIAGNINDLAWCSEPDNRAMYQQKVMLDQVLSGQGNQNRQPDGRWIGMLRVKGEGGEYLRAAMATLRQRENFNQLGLPDLLNQLVEDGHSPQVQYVNGHWMDINNLDDLERAGTFEHTTGE